MLFSFFFALPGLAFTSIIALIIQWKAEQDRKVALAGSRVKVVAKDVIASRKLVYAIALFPFITVAPGFAVLVYTWY